MNTATRTATRPRFRSARWFVVALVALVPLAARASTSQVPPLVEAAKNGDVAAVRALLPKADVNAAQGDGTTALHWAAHRDDVAMADLLIKAGAHITATNRYQMTPLALASLNGSARMVERLLRSE